MRSFTLRSESLHRAAAFGAAACVYLWCFVIVRSELLAASPTALTLGVTINLTGTATLLVWWLGVRPGHLPRAALLVTALTGLVTAALVLPAAAPLRWQAFVYVWGACELILAGLLLSRVVRLVRTVRSARAAGHALSEALELGLQRVLPGRSQWAPRLLAHELCAFAYAFSGWFCRPPCAQGAALFPHACLLEYRALVAALVLLTFGEGLACHVLLHAWSPGTAWAVTGLHVYGLLWLCGDYQGLRLNPVRLSATTLHIELGLRGRATIPLSAIDSIRPAEPADAAAEASSVPLTVLGAPQWLIELRHDVPVTRLFRTFSTRAIGLRGDNLVRELRRSVGDLNTPLAYHPGEI